MASYSIKHRGFDLRSRSNVAELLTTKTSMAEDRVSVEGATFGLKELSPVTRLSVSHEGHGPTMLILNGAIRGETIWG
jgi:hypothetical protein